MYALRVVFKVLGQFATAATEFDAPGLRRGDPLRLAFTDACAFIVGDI